MNVRKASIRKLETGNMTTAEGHELLRNRRYSKLQSITINEMEARGITVASTPSFHKLQCMYWPSKVREHVLFYYRINGSGKFDFHSQSSTRN
jgi:hypothetical protein